jgi:prepilin-type N-terminal cleavage/methylation domain-containing protein
MKDRGVTMGEGDNTGSSAGFTLVELAIVIIVLGVILSIGAVSYANISQSMNLQAAKKQVEAALTRAKLSARQENVEYHITFYPDGSAHANTYEFECYKGEFDEDNEGNRGEVSWSLQPVDKSVSGERVERVTEGIGDDSRTHYYIEISNSVKITSGGTIVFKPTGTEQSAESLTPGGTIPTIGLLSGSKSGSVSVDSQGKITLE